MPRLACSLGLAVLRGLFFAALFGASGCYSSVSYPVSGSTTSSDEVWYVKQKYVLFLRVQHDVYYCPPGQVVSQKVCTKAVMHDD